MFEVHFEIWCSQRKTNKHNSSANADFSYDWVEGRKEMRGQLKQKSTKPYANIHKLGCFQQLRAVFKSFGALIPMCLFIHSFYRLIFPHLLIYSSLSLALCLSVSIFPCCSFFPFRGMHQPLHSNLPFNSVCRYRFVGACFDEKLFWGAFRFLVMVMTNIHV